MNLQSLSRLTLPEVFADRAIAHANSAPGREVGGFFVYRESPDVRLGGTGVRVEFDYRQAPNVAREPWHQMEVEATWIANILLMTDWNLLAFFHSHPAGNAMPSTQRGGDYDTFPAHYVTAALIWGHRTPEKFAKYAIPKGEFEFVDKSEVVIDVRV